MEIREYDLNSYKLHIIKTKKLKTCHMEIHFRDKVKKENIFYKSFLSDILTDCSKKYETRRDVVIALEELYKSTFFGTTSKTGNVINTIFIYDFIAPKYIKEKSYLKETLSLPFEMILNPKVINKEFDIKTFDIIKERTKRDILSIDENAVKLAIKNTLNTMDKDSITSVSVIGTLEELEEITPVTLYNEYLNLIRNDACDIYVIGDIEFDEVYKIVSEKFKLKTIKTTKYDLDVLNKSVKKVNIKENNSCFVQSNLNLLFNLENLTETERNITLQVFNYLLGSGGLSSKFYKKLREENSLCYGVYSIYLKYDGVLIAQVSLDNNNKDKAISLIKESVKEMQKGKFTDEDLEDAKNNLYLSLEMAMDNNTAILSNYIFNKVDNLPTIENRMKMIKQTTKEDIVKVAKKVKLNTIYTLKGGDKLDESNRN